MANNYDRLTAQTGIEPISVETLHVLTLLMVNVLGHFTPFAFEPHSKHVSVLLSDTNKLRSMINGNIFNKNKKSI